MTNDEMLSALKYELEIITDYMDEDARTAKDAQLIMYLDSAKEFITREGISLTDSVGDGLLVVMYAAWLYRRRLVNEPMPRMLRWNLNNRLYQQDISGVPEVTETEENSGDEG